MTAVTSEIVCATCKQEKIAYKCLSCSQNFCMEHLVDHNRELERQLNDIQDKENIFRQNVTEQKTHLEQHRLIEQINQWEYKSIKKIQETADATRKLLLEHMNKYINKIEIKFKKLTKQINDVRQEDTFNEVVLNQLKEKCKELEDEFNTPSLISIKEDPSPFVGKISVVLPSGTFEDLTNIDQTTGDAELDVGQTYHIQRENPIIISTKNDGYAATICCHNNQLLYNEYDQTTQKYCLTFIRNMQNPTAKKTIEWYQPESIINDDDDAWIQDIIYSDKLSSYLLLNRTRLRLFKDGTNRLDEFHTFNNNHRMKRLSCNEKYIYITCTRDDNSHEIILMNYNKEEEIRKAFRDIIPSRLRRVPGVSVPEISDLAVGANDHVVISYRLKRRSEVGVCFYNVAQGGRKWACIKQLILNDCWYDDVSYTPRVEWYGELNSFILIEFITGHLFTIDQDGHVQGECRFMHATNRRDSPLNLTISTTNNFLCVRYESSINIHQFIS